MNKPLIVGNVYNLSLEGCSDEQPQLVAQFPCQTEVNTCLNITNPYYKLHLNICCSTIWLHNVSLFTVKDLTITLKASEVTSLVLHEVSNATIDLLEVYLISESITSSQQGIVLMNCHFIQMHSIIAKNWWSGFLLADSNNIHIYNVSASDNDQMGIFTLNSSNIYLYSSSLTNTSGIHMYVGYNIVINNTTFVNNTRGLHVDGINTAQIVNIVASNNTNTVMQLHQSKYIKISNFTISQSVGYGLDIHSSSSVQIDGITINSNAQLNMYNGIVVTAGYSIVINNTISMCCKRGILFQNVNASQIENTITSNNEVTGIFLLLTRNINISNTSASHNNGNGLEIYHSISVHIDDITVNKNIPLQSRREKYSGIFVTDADNIVINNTVSMYNQLGITFDRVTASQIENTIASNNMVMGMFFPETRNINISNITVSHNTIHGLLIDSSTNFHINNITIHDNTDYGIYLFQTKWVYISRFTTVNRKSISKFIGIEGSRYISIYDTNITVNMSVASSGELFSQPAVIALHNSTLNLSKCIFMGNRITAIKAIASNITLSGNMTFSNNSAYTGSAFILIDNSILILAENCRVHFINNYATNTGGVFSISNTQKFKYIYKCFIINFVSYCNDYDVVPRSNCFLKTQIDNSSMHNFIFTNNSAGKGGDIVYGGYVAYGLNGNKNCMDTFKEISNISEASLSLVSSDPLRVCLQ